MNPAGNGSGGVGSGRNGTGSNGHHPIRRRGLITPLTPDQGCYGCVITIAIIAVTVLIWAFIYWYNETDFHAPGIDESVPTVQEKLHQKTVGGGAPHRPTSPPAGQK